MTINNTRFTNEFKDLIEKEKKSNQIIKAQITGKKDEILEVSTKYPSNLTKNMPIEIDRIPATVLEINNKNMTIKLLKKSNLELNQKVNIQNIQKDIIIHKLQETFDNIKDNKINKENRESLNSIINYKEATYDNKKVNVSKKLNENQRLSVEKALQTDKFHIIQGPPGTGKTHTIIEIIKHLHEEGKRILITTHTHIALDNIIERLDSIDTQDILRIGQPGKVTENSLKYTMDEQIKRHELYPLIIEKEKEIKKLDNHFDNEINYILQKDSKKNSLINKIFKHIFSSDENENGLKNNESYGTNSNNTDEKNELNLEIDNIKNNIQSDILKNIKIIASTVLSSSSFITKEIEFDYMIMDEASQVPVYLALIPLMKTNKFILIGDNKQLQPIQNNNSSYLLNKSIFNLLIDKYPSNHTFLNIQYRMNHEISDIASKLYYGGELLTGDAVRNQRIKLDHNNFLLNEDVITFIDTSNVDFNESNVSGGCCNKYESYLIRDIVKSLIHNNISSDEIGVITPYKKQKIFLQKLFQKEDVDVECDTIYRFQGREKDVILLSFFKSQDRSLTRFQNKFLADENQLNVSITRSRKKLIIIGNYSMVSSALNIKKLINEISPLNIIYLEDVL